MNTTAFFVFLELGQPNEQLHGLSNTHPHREYYAANKNGAINRRYLF